VTYFRFHWIFNVPLLLLLAALGWGEEWTTGAIHAAGWVVLAAFVFTTPWDNHAARRGIWGFPREKYTLRVGWLPVEEYLFFILQTVNVVLGVRALFHFFPDWHRWIESTPDRWTGICAALSVPVWIVIGLQLRGWRRRQGPRVNYLLHLVWFLPVIYAQWLLGPRLFAAHAGLLALVTLAFGLYYTVADYLAVRAGLWFFDPAQITGWKAAGLLPWEEIAFFCLTSLLVAQSYLLLLPAPER
jgi:lycopene cyclase domain-containing protein